MMDSRVNDQSTHLRRTCDGANDANGAWKTSFASPTAQPLSVSVRDIRRRARQRVRCALPSSQSRLILTVETALYPPAGSLCVLPPCIAKALLKLSLFAPNHEIDEWEVQDGEHQAARRAKNQ